MKEKTLPTEDGAPPGTPKDKREKIGGARNNYSEFFKEMILPF